MWRRQRWRSRRQRKKVSRRRIWLFSTLIVGVCLVQFFLYIERQMRDPISNLARVRVKQIATESINEAITAQVKDQKQFDDLIEWKMDDVGKIKGFVINYSAHMKITSDTIHTVQSTLDQISKLSENIPLGQALGSPILASFGPRIPFRIEPKSEVKVDLNTRRQDAGINMILVEVYLRVKTEVAVVVPFDMVPQSVETEIPVSYLLVVGDVPTYYYDNNGNPVGENSPSAPNITLPTHPSEGEKPSA